MSLERHEIEPAETLYRSWENAKRLNCLKRQLCRTAKALSALGDAITAEMEGGQSRPVVKRDHGQKFLATPANRVMGGPDTHELPTADELAELTEGYRQALKDSENYAEQVKSL